MASMSRKQPVTEAWFHEQHSGRPYQDVIERAEEANVGTEELKRLVSRELPSQKFNVQICDTKETFELQLSASAPKEVSQAAYAALTDGIASKEAWTERRSHGVHKVGAHIQNFATNLAKFVEAYSGIVEVVKSAGGPYGSAGYSALSCLLAIAVNKSKSDDMITTQLEAMYNFFPRINLLAEIYEPDKVIAGHVVDVHRNIVFFAKDASLYFLKKSQRFCASITPFGMAVDKRVAQIKASLIEISEWSNIFLHRNTDQLLKKQVTLQSSVDDIKRQNSDLEKLHKTIQDKIDRAKNELESLNTKVDDVKSELEEMSQIEREKQTQKDQDNLEKMRRTLGCPDKRPHCNLEKCSDDIRRAFFHRAGSPGARVGYSKMTPEVLENEDCYQQWNTNPITKLLLIGGTTISESRSYRSGYSWLSPVATDMASALREDGEQVAFFTCHPENWTDSDESRASLPEVIAGMLFQIAEYDPPMLRDKFFRHSNVNLLDVWRTQEDVDEMVDFARRMIRIASTKRRIYIIIDRLDYCDTSPMNVLRCLESITAPPLCNVKILATWHTVEESVAEDCEYFIKHSKDLATGKMLFDQRKGHFPQSRILRRSSSVGHLGGQT